ncbi:MAG: universal stress protein [Bacteroidota bacterium]
MKLIEKILLANDFSRSSENVVATAMEFARIFHAEVVPIHVLPDDLENEKVKYLLHETATQKLQETADRLIGEGVKTGEPILAFGSPHHVIIEAAVDANASLILTGSGETQKGEKFLLGNTAERIIQKSEKPVLVVKEGVALNAQHILCPVDFSVTSKRALKNAITMAHRFKAELTILSVCELQGSLWFTSESDRAMENDSRCAEHKDSFEKFLDEFNLVGLKWKKETRKGKPAEEILSVVSEKMIDLLVIGTSGKTGLNRLVIGSVTEKVIREVPCSFLTLKSEDIISLQLETSIQDIENHYNTALQLTEDGFFEEAIEQFKLCLSINNMHVPSHYGIARVYETMNQTDKAKIYRNSGMEILDRIWDRKIEQEARKLRSR